MSSPSSTTIWEIIRFATLVRLVVLGILVVACQLGQDYDTSSSSLLLSSSESPNKGALDWVIKPLVEPLLRWDAVYFVHIAQEGYVYEQEHAFFPGLPLAMRFVAFTLLAPLQGLVSPTLLLLLAGACIANASAILASAVFYLLGRQLTRSDQLARTAALLFTLTPSAAFMSAPYTESPFALLTFSGMLAYSKGHGTIAALLWSLTTTLRSNGILHAGFFMHDLLREWIRHLLPPRAYHPSLPRSSPSLEGWIRLASVTLLTLLRSALILIPFIIIQFYGYLQYCSSEAPDALRPWCTTSTLPIIYAFVQDHYWNCGPFRYYTLKQLPNFLLASPFLLLTGAGVWVYLRAQTKGTLTLGALSNPGNRSGKGPRGASESNNAHAIYTSSTSLYPYVILWAAQTIYALITMHIQVILRFLTSQPALYLFASSCVLRHLQGPHRHLGGWAILHYFPLYNVVGIVLFANFLPPA
ncbi:MAG: GPI mannosyltransferase 2 [Piptocephalis tieghemiana]|nr:MAG: GPI mannosyltransferase 2 [Piptocephalis tieghemiana]